MAEPGSPGPERSSPPEYANARPAWRVADTVARAARYHARNVGRSLAFASRVSEHWRSVLERGLRHAPARLAQPSETMAYAFDTFRRSQLMLDALRRRGDAFIEHNAEGQPPLLAFAHETVIDGRTLPEPVNHCLLRVLAPPGVITDPTLRPYVIVDPRAGHGAGIGGFKPESQVGVALAAGHPVYFVVFRTEPEPGQTMARVAAAQRRFVREVAQLHPDSPKPALIGNCQGGWAVMALAAGDPEVAGPLVLSGAPLSYWAGVEGRAPMRYTAGLCGGSWPVYLLGDLGNGRFDGAWLVGNFERLNPAATAWTKYYHLFAEVDTEVPRFLEFERWWGGFVQLARDEMRDIVDELFVGNRLTTAAMPLRRGETLDLRRIRSPVVVFCSHGDDITPPQQALNWIVDTYASTREIKAQGQTLVYCVHADAGHLGLFVSGSVVRREFSGIAGTLACIEALPPGLYELLIVDAETGPDSLPRYDVMLAERDITDIASYDDTREDEGAFRLVDALSGALLRGYELFWAPAVRLAVTESGARWRRQMHPMRLRRAAFSSLNPLLAGPALLQPMLSRLHGQVAPDNPWLALQSSLAGLVEGSIQAATLVRDGMIEGTFHAFYGWLDAVGAGEGLTRSVTPTQGDAFDMSALLPDALGAGGVREAVLRMLLLLMGASGGVRRETLAYVQTKLRADAVFSEMDADGLRALVVAQAAIVAAGAEQALAALAVLLPDSAARARAVSSVRAALPQGVDRLPAVQTWLDRFDEVLDLPARRAA